MDIAHVERLKEEQKKGLHLCEEKISQWEKFKQDYETLKERLETFPDALSYDITVPISSQAFTKGKVVHTNEVMVLLGDNWFAEVSMKQAASIADRRLKQCVEMLSDLQKEKEHLNHWVEYIEEVTPKEELVEIMETYNEEEERKWREQHAARVRSHRQQLARERQNSGGSVSEEDPLSRLDSLEESESQGKSGESEDGGSSFFEECSDSEEQVLREPLEGLRLDCKVATSFEEERKESSESNECSSSLESSKHVRWQDLSRQNIKRITFKHTKNQTKNRHHHQLNRSQSNSVSADEGVEGVERLQSPSDIYRQFGAFFQSSPPKSILKVKHSPSSESEEPFFQPKEEEEVHLQKHAVIGEVRENSSPIHITQKKPRPASHFKNSRKNRKKW